MHDPAYRPRSMFAWALSIVLSLLSQASLAAAPAPSWTIYQLGALGPRGSVALTLNNRGDVGGYTAVVPPGTTNWYYHAFLWQNGTMTDLGAQIGSPPGYTFSQVSAMNDRGTLVLNGYLGIMTWKDGLITPLGFSGAVGDINNKDVIVGSYSYGAGGRAYRYADGVFLDLGTLGGTYSVANAINDHGVIVGTSYLAGDGETRGFIYDNGTMTPIGTFGGFASTAVDINSHGVVIGDARDASGTWQPYILDKAGMRRLPNVPAGSTLFAINDRGQVIGSYANANNQGSTNFVWEDGVMTPLEQIPEVKAAGWTNLFVIDMNDRGWITGWGWKAGGSPDGEAFLLVPK